MTGTNWTKFAMKTRLWQKGDHWCDETTYPKYNIRTITCGLKVLKLLFVLQLP